MRQSHVLAVALMSSIALLGCKPADKASEGSVMNGVESAATNGASTLPSPSMNPAFNLKEATDFLAANKTKTGVQTTASGLQYAVISSGAGDGPKPTPSDTVQVNYEGKLISGQVFDSSFAKGQAAEFLVGELIPAWVEALQLMRPGDEWTIWVPPSIGYGEMGTPDGSIPPNSMLIFRMRLEKIVGGPNVGLGVKADKGATK